MFVRAFVFIRVSKGYIEDIYDGSRTQGEGCQTHRVHKGFRLTRATGLTVEQFTFIVLRISR